MIRGVEIKFHPSYHREPWKESEGPVFFLEKVDLGEDKILIRFVCSREGCRRCENGSLPIKGHGVLVGKDGLSFHPQAQWENEGTKKEKAVLKRVQVFIKEQ